MDLKNSIKVNSVSGKDWVMNEYIDEKERPFLMGFISLFANS
jgi:hypothetical protein